MATVSKWNVAEIPALVDVAVEHEADIFAFARYCPSMADRNVTCSPQEYRDMMEACWERFQKYEARGCKTTFSLKDHLWILFQYEKGLFDPGRHDLRRMQLRQLPYDHPLRRGGVRLPPDGEQGGQCPCRRSL